MLLPIFIGVTYAQAMSLVLSLLCSLATPSFAQVEDPKPVLVNVKEGTKLRYRIEGETRTWGSNDGERFLIPVQERDRFALTLLVEVGKTTDTFNFKNTVVDYAEGGRKALAQFDPDQRSWPSWCDPMGVMSPRDLGHAGELDEPAVRKTLLNLLRLYADATVYMVQGRFIYTLPLGLGFRDKPWGLGTDKLVMYKWTKEGDHAHVEITRSKHIPDYGDDDYGKPAVYVTGNAQLSLSTGLLEHSDITIDNETTSMHLVSSLVADKP